MTNQKSGLTASNIKYLLAMEQIYRKTGTIRCVKIAEALAITKPSVHTMLDTLKKLNLVRKDYRSEVFFTEEGLKAAAKYSACYEVLSGMLGMVLTDEADICSAACAVLGEISEDGLSRLCAGQTGAGDTGKG